VLACSLDFLNIGLAIPLVLASYLQCGFQLEHYQPRGSWFLI